jgi:hypothetical protein
VVWSGCKLCEHDFGTCPHHSFECWLHRINVHGGICPYHRSCSHFRKEVRDEWVHLFLDYPSWSSDSNSHRWFHLQALHQPSEDELQLSDAYHGPHFSGEPCCLRSGTHPDLAGNWDSEVNEHEIEFADQTAKRAFEASRDMDKYLEKIIRVSVAYADSIKLTTPNTWTLKFDLGDWSVKIKDAYERWGDAHQRGAHYFLLKYKKVTLICLDWTIVKTDGKKHPQITFVKELAKDQLFYITEYVNHVDVELTQMSTMMQKVNL